VGLAAGSNFGVYRIMGPLGRGGMASVYRAYEPALDRYVAIKVLPAESVQEETSAERFRREAKVIARLEHPNIIPIFAYGIEDGLPWMAMRLVGGGSLAALLKAQRLAAERCVAILAGVADALDYAHGKGVVHRDVKPQNVLLDESQRVYLADFGIARLTETATVLTAAGLITGTPQYMAPEQATGKPVDSRADIYALGVVAYEMLTGRVPFSADTPVAVLMKHVTEPIPVPTAGEVPEPLVRALLKALAKSPDDRWDTAGDFVRALQAGPAAPAPRATLTSPTLSVAGARVTAAGVPALTGAQPSPLATAPALHPTARGLPATWPPTSAPTAPGAAVPAPAPPARRSAALPLALGGAAALAALAVAVALLWDGGGAAAPSPSPAPVAESPLAAPPPATAPPATLAPEAAVVPPAPTTLAAARLPGTAAAPRLEPAPPAPTTTQAPRPVPTGALRLDVDVVQPATSQAAPTLHLLITVDNRPLHTLVLHFVGSDAFARSRKREVFEIDGVPAGARVLGVVVSRSADGSGERAQGQTRIEVEEGATTRAYVQARFMGGGDFAVRFR
jgi:serine/threonine-protein kinase